MTENERDAKIFEFFRNVFKKYDADNDGTIAASELGSVLSALGRPADAESLQNLIRRFDTDQSGKVDWTNGEFLSVIAMLDVIDVSLIDNFVISTGFNTFDLDSDGLITRMELHIVIRLFLPMDAVQEDKYVENLINKMDVNNDGKIGFEEFVKFIRESGASGIFL